VPHIGDIKAEGSKGTPNFLGARNWIDRRINFRRQINRPARRSKGQILKLERVPRTLLRPAHYRRTADVPAHCKVQWSVVLHRVTRIGRAATTLRSAPWSLTRRGELIDESGRQSRGIPLRRRIRKTADGGLRGERRTAYRTAADRHLQRRIMPQLVMIDGTLTALADPAHARFDGLGEAVANACGIAPVAQCCRHAADHADLRLSSSCNNTPASDDWLPPSRTTVSFLRRTAGRSKRSGVKSSMVVAFRCDASTLVSTTVCYALSTFYATAAFFKLAT
jgi:hypothetical protein